MVPLFPIGVPVQSADRFWMVLERSGLILASILAMVAPFVIINSGKESYIVGSYKKKLLKIR
jgi:hypothetical protein